ncbi:ATPase PAAT isoform X1 [Oryzias melastigma]|uniref:Si:rp71-19m20.1 n=1 Tax=Oryzias melastigma TaxID=30732 RepID=A0A3B3DVH4_ORYME|nr:ATPase PAAT isoform X1 [Oryzias melastigma]XP_024140665.1 ATPase PAAT isoform X1 [Oryzias melastigma]
MVDVSVKSEAAWVCPAAGRHLAQVLLPLPLSHEEELSQSDEEQTEGWDPVLLEQVEDGHPCVLTLRCSPDSCTAIRRLVLITEARTMEVYDQSGEYCGTARGSKTDRVVSDSADRGPFFSKQLLLERPSSACEVKLLSLAGRSSVLVGRIIVGLQSLQPRPLPISSIDLQRVQGLVEEMGATLSPGAQNLMEMVQFQQHNSSGSLGSFLPLLMGGGALSALAEGGGVSSIRRQPPPEASLPTDCFSSAELTPLAENRGKSEGSAPPAPPQLNGNKMNTENGLPLSPAHLTTVMSDLLKQQGCGEVLSPDLLPVLQSVCGQVTRLRLDSAPAAERESELRNGCWKLDPAMEQRLEEMERRLKEHMDRRLDALEQKLEKVLLSALPMMVLKNGAAGAGEQIAHTPCVQQS